MAARSKILFLSGTALGYILGARAGRARYDELKAATAKVLNDPALRHTARSIRGALRARMPDRDT